VPAGKEQDRQRGDDAGQAIARVFSAAGAVTASAGA
jgi:hypothetical protein